MPAEVVPTESPSARSSSCRRANAVPALTRSPVSGEPWRLEDSTSSAELLMQGVVTLVVGCHPPVFLGNMAYLGIQAFHQILSTPTLSLSLSLSISPSLSRISTLRHPHPLPHIIHHIQLLRRYDYNILRIATLFHHTTFLTVVAALIHSNTASSRDNQIRAVAIN